MPNIGDINTALAYNTLKGKVANVLGKGIGDKGYGQIVTLPDVSKTVITSAKHWTDLRELINQCKKHQIGDGVGYSSSVLPVITAGSIMAASQIKQYENAIDDIYTNSLEYGALSMSSTNLGVITRTSSWSSSISCEFTCVWSNEDNARFFFNSGGDIRIKLSHPTGTYNNKRWNEILNKVGTITIKARSTVALNGSIGPGHSRGYYDIGSNLTEIFAPSDSTGSYGGYGSGSGIVVVSAAKISNGLRVRVSLNEASSSVMTANTKASITLLKAERYLTNPNIVIPTFTKTKNF